VTTTTSFPRAAPRSWLRAASLILVVALAAVLAAAAGPRLSVWWKERALPRGEKPTVLLVTLDATRADHLGCYGYAAGQTPAADELAQQGVLFEQAYVQVPLCLPSHATLLTGRWPFRHGVRGELDVLGPQVPTLAEQFRSAGYRTAAFVSTSSLDQSRGLGRGFDVYQDDFGLPGKRPGAYERGAASVIVNRVLAWMETVDTRPLFLWVHLADSMAPHNLPEARARDFAGRPYDGEVAEVDGHMGRLVSGVRRRHPQTLVAALADHGESLGDHGEDTFGYFVYSATTRVPFLVSMPGRLPSGVRVPAIVRSVDLAPTLLDLVGLPAPPGLDGASLVPLMVGSRREGPGPAPIENVSLRPKYGLAPLFALRSGPYLFVKAPRSELYDVAQDPQEKDDASARLTRIASNLAAEVQARIPDAAAPENRGLPDPKDTLDLYNRYQLAQEMEGHRDFAHAVAAYRSILSEAPGFTNARRKLSEALIRAGEFGESEPVMKELIEKNQAVDGTYLNLALVRYRAKKTDEALDWLYKGVTAFPASAPLRHRLGRLLLEVKRYNEAERQLREAQALEPRFLDVYVALGAALDGLGRKDEARAVYERVREIAPESSEAGEAAVALGLAPSSPAPAGSPSSAPAESPIPYGTPPP
jgi:arylsulfatase A-like enzyme/predicted negative regulator of RcsB-dependent stress response